MPAFERQNMGIVSNLALSNLNQDIEDLQVPDNKHNQMQ